VLTQFKGDVLASGLPSQRGGDISDRRLRIAAWTTVLDTELTSIRCDLCA
jgi:hypothetical protein